MGGRQSFRHRGSESYKALKVKNSTLNWAQKQISNQCSQAKTHGICSCFLVSVHGEADIFCIRCSFQTAFLSSLTYNATWGLPELKPDYPCPYRTTSGLPAEADRCRLVPLIWMELQFIVSYSVHCWGQALIQYILLELWRKSRLVCHQHIDDPVAVSGVKKAWGIKLNTAEPHIRGSWG